MTGPAHANELRYGRETFGNDELFAFGKGRQHARTKLPQLLTSMWIVIYVNVDKIDASLRKKLFRFETVASPGVGEQRKFFVCSNHKPTFILQIAQIKQATLDVDRLSSRRRCIITPLHPAINRHTPKLAEFSDAVSAFEY